MLAKVWSGFVLAAMLLKAQSFAAPLSSSSLEARGEFVEYYLRVIQLAPGSTTKSTYNQGATFNNFQTLVQGDTGDSYGFGIRVVQKANGTTPEIIQVFTSGITCIGAHLPTGASRIELVPCAVDDVSQPSQSEKDEAASTYFYSRNFTVDGVAYRQLELAGNKADGWPARPNVHVVSSGEVHVYTENPSEPKKLYMLYQD